MEEKIKIAIGQKLSESFIEQNKNKNFWSDNVLKYAKHQKITTEDYNSIKKVQNE